jgi:hypothetical protein
LTKESEVSDTGSLVVNEEIRLAVLVSAEFYFGVMDNDFWGGVHEKVLIKIRYKKMTEKPNPEIIIRGFDDLYDVVFTSDDFKHIKLE